MTLRDLASIDRQLDAIDPDGSIAARGRACVARAPGDAAIDLVGADAGLEALAEGSAFTLGASSTRVVAFTSPEPTAPSASGAAEPPPPLPAASASRPHSVPPPIPTQSASHVAAMLADADMTFIPGSMPVPRLPFPGSSNSSSYESAEKDAGDSPWSKSAEAIPAPAATPARANDVGVDPNLDFDDLFEDFVPPAASVPLSMAPPASALPLDEPASESTADDVAVSPHEPAVPAPLDADVEELLDDDELEIVLDD